MPHALQELQQSSKLAGDEIPWPLASLGHAYARMGKTAEAEQVLVDLDRWSKRSYVPPYFFAALYAGLGKKDDAFAWLEKAYADRSMVLAQINIDPDFESLHSDARYGDLLRRMGLRE